MLLSMYKCKIYILDLISYILLYVIEISYLQRTKYKWVLGNTCLIHLIIIICLWIKNKHSIPIAQIHIS